MPRVAHLAAERRRHRLVEQREPLLGAPERDVVDPELAQRADLEVEVPQLARDRQRPLVVALGLLRARPPGARAAPRARPAAGRRRARRAAARRGGTSRRRPRSSRTSSRARSPARSRSRPRGRRSPARRKPAYACSRCAIPASISHWNQSAWPSPSRASGSSPCSSRRSNSVLRVLPVALLERGPGRLAAGRRRASLHGARAYRARRTSPSKRPARPVGSGVLYGRDAERALIGVLLDARAGVAQRRARAARRAGRGQDRAARGRARAGRRHACALGPRRRVGVRAAVRRAAPAHPTGAAPARTPSGPAGRRTPGRPRAGRARAGTIAS